MGREQKNIQDKGKKSSSLKKLLSMKIIIPIAIIVLLVVFAVGLSSYFSTDGKTTKLGFEDIGELATQSATCTSVRVEDKDRTLLGVAIPFTNSKAIYSYDVIIKAGIDFGEVKWKVDEDNKKVRVKIPEIKIISSNIDYDSFKLYHEDESVFTPISMEERNESMKDLQATSEKDAIANGLYDNARDNAEVMLTAFIQQVYSPNEYKIEFSTNRQGDNE